jgi:HSP20 family molecular chaperone IbpA
MDIKETENDLILKADVPDVDMKDIDVRVENGTLTLRGERKFESEKKEGSWHRVERSYGRFERAFALPETVDFGSESRLQKWRTDDHSSEEGNRQAAPDQSCG